jgi:hypothetical protein
MKTNNALLGVLYFLSVFVLPVTQKATVRKAREVNFMMVDK